MNDFKEFPKSLRELVSHEVPVMAFVRRVSDGDTIVAFMDRRFYDGSVKRLRLKGVNAEELGTPNGDIAAMFLTDLLPPGTPIIVTTFKITYDRYEAHVMFGSPPQDLGDYLIEKGHVVKV